MNRYEYDEAVLLSMNEANMQAELEAQEQQLKRAWDIIMNPEYREQASKVSKEVLARQSKMLEQGRNPAGYYDDDYDDDDYDDDECYPDDE